MSQPLHPIETLAPEALDRLVDKRIEAIFAHAQAHSPFHRERLAGLSVTGRADLASVPVLDKDAWMNASPPYGTDALTGPLEAAYIFRTGGSTGEPKFSVFSSAEFRRFVPYFERSYYAVGLRPSDRVANLFAAGSLYASFVFINRFLEEMGTLNFPITTSMPPELVAQHVERFGINTLLGFPSWLLQVATALVERGVTVEKVFYAGEHLYDEERRFLQEKLGARVIGSAGYAAVDAGPIAYQCEHATGGHHHVLSEHAHVEIVDPETFAPLPEGEEGLILVTNLERELHPVLRYSVGDLGRFVPEPCPCGRTSRLFELRRRGDDALRIGYANLTYDEISAAFAAIPELTSTIQMVKEREARRDRLTFKIELRGEVPHDPTALAARLEAALTTAKPDIAKLLASGYLHPIGFEFLPAGAIPRLPVTGKFKRTLDLSR